MCVYISFFVIKSQLNYGGPWGFQEMFRGGLAITSVSGPWTLLVVFHPRTKQGQSCLMPKIWWAQTSLGQPGHGLKSTSLTHWAKLNFLREFRVWCLDLTPNCSTPKVFNTEKECDFGHWCGLNFNLHGLQIKSNTLYNIMVTTGSANKYLQIKYK